MVSVERKTGKINSLGLEWRRVNEKPEMCLQVKEKYSDSIRQLKVMFRDRNIIHLHSTKEQF